MEFTKIVNTECLRNLYDSPKKIALKKQKAALDSFSRKYIEIAPFAILSTASKAGSQDCSPRGDYPGFIKILDDANIAIPDRPGNNRLDCLTNIIGNPFVGLLLLVPGINECLRINGSAYLSDDPRLVGLFEYEGKLPKSVIVVSISNVYFHCAKAINRSRLWNEASRVERSILPKLGRILMNQAYEGASEEEIKSVEDAIELRAKTTLY